MARGEKMELVVLCSAGLEKAPCIELKKLGFKIKTTTSGHVHFDGHLIDIPKLNLYLKSADRVMINVTDFPSETFDELFEGTFSANWNELVHKRGTIVVEKVKITNSKLSAKGAVASIVKKAIYSKIKSDNQPDGIIYPMYIYIKNNFVSLMLDTTGKNSLSKRGYRMKTSSAPLRETIAAALILISGWDQEVPLIDPFCGSGTIAIEAARIALQMQNNKRSFSFENWPLFKDLKPSIVNQHECKRTVAIGYDKNPDILQVANENAIRAGVKKYVRFHCSDFEKLPIFREKLHIVTNPPFGLRMREGNASFYRKLSKLRKIFPDARLCLITPREDLQKMISIKLQRKFRFQNSGLWTWCYIF